MTAGLIVAVLTACSPGGAALHSAASCPSPVQTDALPGWARTGFTGDGSGTPHVLGAHGDIVAVLFSYPPHASADPSEGNKILWVPRLPLQPSNPLHIDAALDGGGASFRRDIPDGPGPSSVAFPRSGCWRLDLRWGADSDSLAVKVE